MPTTTIMRHQVPDGGRNTHARDGRHRAHPDAPAAPRPLPLWQALLFFGVPAVLFRLALYNGTDLLVTHGVSESVAVITAFLVPSALLLLAAFIAQRTRNTSVTQIVHLLYNGLTPILLLLVVLGVVH